MVCACWGVCMQVLIQELHVILVVGIIGDICKVVLINLALP